MLRNSSLKKNQGIPFDEQSGAIQEGGGFAFDD